MSSYTINIILTLDFILDVNIILTRLKSC